MCTEFSNLAQGKTFILALLRHKAGLIHTLDGQQHTRDDSVLLACVIRKLETTMRDYSPKLEVSESQDEMCFSTSIPLRFVSTYDIMEQVLSSQ